MVKTTKQLGGTAKDKYFNGLFSSVSALSPEMVKRLVDLTRSEVAQVRVRNALLDRTHHSAGAALAADQARPAAQAPKATTFDPFVFTAVVVLKRSGAEELKKRLAEIEDCANLRLLAEKQHLGIPGGVKDAAEMRDAIVAAAKARIDDRRAAAS